jgi:D-beta-D-heptose 7-phosphate kinase/D-beta-D-heptose 1-phosphate adenosyltransferase
MQLKKFLEAAPSVRVLVAGDVMLDAWVMGSASRISPEAPVPVVSVSRRKWTLGGAGNVAANVRALGAGAALAGVAGRDSSGETLRHHIAQFGIGAAALVSADDRVTTTKTRVTVGGHQLVRYDDEGTDPVVGSPLAELQERCEAELAHTHVCVVSDYAKGIFRGPFLRWLIDAAVARGIPVVADPKARDLSIYRGATVITPNLREASEAAGDPLASTEELNAAARNLLTRVTPSQLLITRGEHGMTLYGQDGSLRHLPALVNEVADVTGAGDTVVAALAIGLGGGLELFEAAKIASAAAAIAVSHHGTWAVRAEELAAAANF